MRRWFTNQTLIGALVILAVVASGVAGYALGHTGGYASGYSAGYADGNPDYTKIQASVRSTEVNYFGYTQLANDFTGPLTSFTLQNLSNDFTLLSIDLLKLDTLIQSYP